MTDEIITCPYQISDVHKATTVLERLPLGDKSYQDLIFQDHELLCHPFGWFENNLLAAAATKLLKTESFV